MNVVRRFSREDYSDELAVAQVHRYDEGQRKIKTMKVREQLAIFGGQFVLDLGCGPGVFSNLCSKLGASVVAMDFAESMLAITKQRHGLKFPIIQGEANFLPFKDNVFDTVIALDVIEHVYELEAVLSEVQRVTKRDSIMLLTTPKTGFSVGYFPSARAIVGNVIAKLPITVQDFIRGKMLAKLPIMIQEFIKGSPSSRRLLNTHVKLYKPSELCQLARANGFSLDYMDTFPNRNSFGIWGQFIEFLFVGPLRRYKWKSVIYRFRREEL